MVLLFAFCVLYFFFFSLYCAHKLFIHIMQTVKSLDHGLHLWSFYSNQFVALLVNIRLIVDWGSMH